MSASSTTTPRTRDLTALYNQIHTQGHAISQSPLFQNQAFATSLNEGMTQLRLWARTHTSPTNSFVSLNPLSSNPRIGSGPAYPESPQIFRALARLAVEPDKIETSRESSLEEVVYALSSARVGAVIAQAARTLILEIGEALRWILDMLNAFTENEVRGRQREKDGKNGEDSVEEDEDDDDDAGTKLVEAGEEFCAAVRALYRFRGRIDGLVPRTAEGGGSRADIES